jgi:hypothetical protein
VVATPALEREHASHGGGNGDEQRSNHQLLEGKK